MFDLPVEVTAALISAVIALVVSFLFRFLDSEKPYWRLDVPDEAIPKGLKEDYVLKVTLRNVGNGAAYDVEILTPLRTNDLPRASSVVQPGEELHALIPIHLGRLPEHDSMGIALRAQLEAEDLAGVRVKVRWTRPPLFWWTRRARFSAQRAFVRRKRLEAAA